MKWISVKESLPEIGSAVLIYGNDVRDKEFILQSYLAVRKGADGADVKYFRWCDYCTVSNINYDAITHWMPLPDLLEGE